MKTPSAVASDGVRNGAVAGPDPGRWTGADWRAWLAVMGCGLLLRTVFYSGFFGSDEVTYTLSAFQLLEGNWSVSDYVGANRYGVNLPVAAFAGLFGRNEFAAALYSMLCSLGEIALVFYVGRRMLGRRAGLLAALVLAFLPIHVNSAGRLLADAPLALAITATFVFFWHGETTQRAMPFALAGLAAGLAFWVKPPTVVYLVLFLACPLLFRRWNWRWAWLPAGFVLMVLANCLLFWALTGHPLFLFEAMQARKASGYLESTGAASGSFGEALLYYPAYLFVKLYHTWVAAYLAAFATGAWLLNRRPASAPQRLALRYLVWWSLGLLLLFSLLVVSWRPILFIPKQANYILIFVAPIALLAGQGLGRLTGTGLRIAIALVFVPALLLCGMEQNVVRVFTANSKAAVAFARSHADAEVFVTTNAFRAATFYNLVRPDEPVGNVHSVVELKNPASGRSGARRYAVIDTETLAWGTDEPITRIAAVPSCWSAAGVLEPAGLGAGTRMLDAVRPVLGLLPGGVSDAVMRKLDGLTRPAPAYLYEIPPAGCPLDSGSARSAG